MMTLRIAITGTWGSPQQWVEALSALLPQAHVFLYPGADADAGEHGVRADYAVGSKADADFFAANPQLRAFFTISAGVDRLLANAALPASLPIVRIEDGGMAAEMTEYCMHEAIRLHRRFADYEAQQREAIWRKLDVDPKAAWPIGVFGLGAIGAPIARALAAAGFPVRGYARSPRRIDGVDCFDDRDGLRSFLSGTRLLVVVAPHTSATEGLFDAERLRWLMPGAWLVNIARGALIDEAALLDAIDSGHLAGATLDVFAVEPLPPGHPFWQHRNIRITPHVSGITQIDESARQIAHKIAALERGDPVGGIVDRRRGY